MKPYLLIIKILLLFTFSCKKNDEDTVKPNELEKPITNEWKDQPYKLNVIYFLPNNNDSISNFRQRISKILLDGQQFFAKESERNGFERKSFGLSLVNDSLVNIIVIKGAMGKENYLYEGGGGKIIPEIDRYFEGNKSQKTSEHYLVILPTNSSNPETNPEGDVPYYGLGRYCFAVDYLQLDSKYLGKTGFWGEKATVYIGGLLHELGHGLNFPHDYGTSSQVKKFGTNLMGAGNYSYGSKPTFISRGSSAIFNTGQTFTKTTRNDWYENFDFNLTKLDAKLENESIKIDLGLESSKKIVEVVAFFDREPYEPGNDYDAITFVANKSAEGFSLDCPLNDFEHWDKDYQLNLRFVGENGSIKTVSYFVPVKAGKPDLSDVFLLKLSNRSKWKGEASSSQDSEVLIKTLDGNLETIWHSMYWPTVDKLPHTLNLDTNADTKFNTLYFYNRENITGSIKTFDLKTSADGTTWKEQGTYSLKHAAGAQFVNLPTTINARFITINIKEVYSGVQYSHLAEFDVLMR